ncbi:MAG: TRAP transporter small permease subunit [Pseudomonadota bacterium]
MNSLATLCNAISTATGRALAWLVYAMMLISCLVVVLRYGFGISIIAMQESVTYLHACVFMLGAAYTLQQGEHVRVDILYRNFSTRRKALVDLTGTVLFLVPLCLYLLYASQDYVSNAWTVRETSVEKDGIPAVFLLKSLIPMMSILLLIQAIAEVVKNLLAMRNRG